MAQANAAGKWSWVTELIACLEAGLPKQKTEFSEKTKEDTERARFDEKEGQFVPWDTTQENEVGSKAV